MTEFFLPLSLTSDVFFAPSLRYELQTLQVVADGRRVARYRVAGIGGGARDRRGAVNWGEVRAGFSRGDGSAQVMIGDPGLPRREFDLGAGFLKFGYDRLDSAYFPKQGQAFSLGWRAERESFGSSEDADIVEAEWLMARSHKRYSAVFGMEWGSALDDRVVSPQQLFTLGGFLKLSGLPTDAIAGTQYGFARAIAFRRVSRGGTGFLEFPAYLGVSLEAGNVWQTRDDVDWGDPWRRAACSWAPRVRSARCTSPRASARAGRRVLPVARAHLLIRGLSRGAGRPAARVRRDTMAGHDFHGRRNDMATFHEHNSVSPCPPSVRSASASDCAAATRCATCWGTTGRRSTGTPRATSATRRSSR